MLDDNTARNREIIYILNKKIKAIDNSIYDRNLLAVILKYERTKCACGSNTIIKNTCRCYYCGAYYIDPYLDTMIKRAHSKSAIVDIIFGAINVASYVYIYNFTVNPNICLIFYTFIFAIWLSINENIWHEYISNLRYD
jgi:hypothetical protein